MSSLTLPTALANARFLREALSERKGPFLSEEERELIQFCDIIAGLFRAFLRGVNESLAEGVGSRSLRAKLTEGITTAAEAREDCATLQDRLDLEPDAPEALAHALSNAIAEIDRIHAELVKLAAWLDSPPPTPSLEKLAEASKGPFVPMRN